MKGRERKRVRESEREREREREREMIYCGLTRSRFAINNLDYDTSYH
jgi:hypothetical protein